jgi:uncharacterized protein
MAEVGTTIPEHEIRTAVERIVTLFSPRQVLLFGSYASGSPTPDSDVDLLVTMDTDLRPVEQAVAIREAIEFRFPLDLLVRTPEQLAERARLGDAFFQEILDRGVVLYEDADKGVG